jgi:hypothetical protein
MKIMRAAAIAASVALIAGIATAADTKLKLTGAEEVPAVTTSATGESAIKVASDGAVTGKVTTKGIVGVAAHIHTGAVGQSGPPIITLVHSSDDVWSVPEGAKLTSDQLASYKSGGLYVNVHSAEHKSGEIRVQLKP